MGQHVTAAYEQIAPGTELAELRYEETEVEEQGWLDRFAKARLRDRAVKTTTVGPHRDDYELLLGGKPASDYGSEGQQRSLVIALRLAQMAFFREQSGIEPILLADDILGELDPQRRERFWASLGRNRQVIATGTRVPEADLGEWQVFRVANGSFNSEGETRG
jgi:DNA replication and repair protein RecF